MTDPDLTVADALVAAPVIDGTGPGPGAKQVVVIGIGDFARCVAVYLQHDGGRQVAAFAVHAEHLDGPELLGRPVVALEQLVETHPPAEFDAFVAVGYSKLNAARVAMVEELRGMGYALATYVSPRAQVAPHVRIGANCAVFEDNVLQPFVTIGENVVLWSGNHVGHDVTIGDHCFIASHAVLSGRVSLGERCFVGVNATFRDQVTVAPECIIGGAAVVMADVTERGSVLAVRSTPALEKRAWDVRI